MSLLINSDYKEKDERKDPTSFLPEEEMCYELKKKKKKKKKKKDMEDPFKDVDEKLGKNRDPDITALDPDVGMDPEVTIKVENIQVDLDFNDFIPDADFEPDNDSIPEPAIKFDEQNKDAILLTFESVINEKVLYGEEIKVKTENLQESVENTENVEGEESEPEPTHFCKMCHLVFKNPRTLLMHQKRKHKKFFRYFKHICDDCGMSYDARNSLMSHIKRKHGPDAQPADAYDPVTCDICALVFKGKARLRIHMRRKHNSYQDTFRHKCDHCGITYEKRQSLLVHIKRKHSNRKKPKSQWYTCPQCAKLFTNRETYSRHIQRKHQLDGEAQKEEDQILKNTVKNPRTGEVTCNFCPLVFSSITYLKLHMRRKHNVLNNDFRLKCKLCNLSYDKLESLKRHVRRKHEQDAYMKHSHTKTIQECNLCGLIFASQGGLAKHLRCTHKVPMENTVYCNICNAGFTEKRYLRPHFLKVHLNTRYPCQFCDKTLKTKESFRRHLIFKHPDKYVEETKTHQCEQCPDKFANEFELCKHINTAHIGLDKDVKLEDVVIKKEEHDARLMSCIKCENTYSTWEELKQHFEQVHHAIEETQCQTCGELLPRNELPKHMKSHEEIEMSCKYCEYKTKNKTSMTQHTLRHRNATAYHCDFNGCRYKTFYEEAMTKHKRKHTDIGVKLQCTSCPFQTMNKYILRYHEEAHVTGKKRYACDQCDYATILPANLVQHKYKHSNVKRFKCEVCPFATKYNTSLRFHVRKKHCDLPTQS